jgi:type I restriction enzyme, R subunit
MTPEERARKQIDLLLQQSGWIVSDRSQTNLSAGAGVAIREAVLKTGEADYLLFVGAKAIATVEAKPEGHTLTGVEEQSGKYAKGRVLHSSNQYSERSNLRAIAARDKPLCGLSACCSVRF